MYTLAFLLEKSYFNYLIYLNILYYPFFFNKSKLELVQVKMYFFTRLVKKYILRFILMFVDSKSLIQVCINYSKRKCFAENKDKNAY